MIVIIDYGIGNIRSVQRAVLSLGKNAKVTCSPEIIKKSKKIIFPGVGHFGEAAAELKKRKIFSLIKEKIKEGTPFLGLCVGMQLLLDESEEAPGIKGLGIIPGKVKKFKNHKKLVVPHMGWNQVSYQAIGDRLEAIEEALKPKGIKTIGDRRKTNLGEASKPGKIINPLFKNIPQESYFYFAHSYYCCPKDLNSIAATTDYGVKFASVLNKNNTWGTQFHPEKSQALGLKLFANFLEL